jgi:hypothetical protein
MSNYNKLTKSSTPIIIPTTSSSSSSSSIQVTTSTTTSTSSTTTTAATSYVDKENYYNASRRENLLPVNSYEYRNSYKDHYDHQGVRVNPAILKALPQELQQTINPILSSPTQQQQQITSRNSSIVITPSSSSQQKTNNLINDVSQLLNYPQNGKFYLFLSLSI